MLTNEKFQLGAQNKMHVMYKVLKWSGSKRFQIQVEMFDAKNWFNKVFNKMFCLELQLLCLIYYIKDAWTSHLKSLENTW
jgi:hypothetical protein